MRFEINYTSVLTLFSFLIFVTGDDDKCTVKVELTSDRMLQVTNQDEFCSCLKYEVSVKTSMRAEPCDVETHTVGGRLAISAENICICAGYETNLTKKEIIVSPAFTTKEEEAVLLPPKEKNDSHITDRGKILTIPTTYIPRIKETKIRSIVSTTTDTTMPSKKYTSNTTDEIDDTKTVIPDVEKVYTHIDNSTTELNNSKYVSDPSKTLILVNLCLTNDTTDNCTDKTHLTRLNHDLEKFTSETKLIGVINPINETIESEIIVPKKDLIKSDNVTDTTIVNIMSKDKNKTFDTIKPTEAITKINVTENFNITSDDVIDETTVHSKPDYDYKYYIKIYSLNKTIEVDGWTDTTPPVSEPNDVSSEALDKKKTDLATRNSSYAKTLETNKTTTKNISISNKHEQLSADSKKARENFLKVLVIVLLSILVVILIVVVILNIIYSCIRRGSYALPQIAERQIEMKTKR